MILVSVVFQFLPLMFDLFHQLIGQLAFCLWNVLIVQFVCFYFDIGQSELFVQILSWYLFYMLLLLNWLLFFFLQVTKTSWEWVVLFNAEFIVEFLDSRLVWDPWKVHRCFYFQKVTLKFLLKLFYFIYCPYWILNQFLTFLYQIKFIAKISHQFDSSLQNEHTIYENDQDANEEKNEPWVTLKNNRHGKFVIEKKVQDKKSLVLPPHFNTTSIKLRNNKTETINIWNGQETSR